MTDARPDRGGSGAEFDGVRSDAEPVRARSGPEPARSGPEPARPGAVRSRTGRPLALLAALVLLGAAAGAGAAAMTWWTAGYLDPLTGPLTLSASGSDCVPELVPVALVALAGFGATLASQGWLRRLVGVVLLADGLLVAVRAGLSLTGPPAAITGGLVRPADPVGPAQLHPFGPVLAMLGGVLLVVAGALVIAGLGGRRRLDARYDAPIAAGATTPTQNADTEPHAPSDDPGDWWKALDAGADPTDRTVSDGPSAGGYHDPSERAT